MFSVFYASEKVKNSKAKKMKKDDEKHQKDLDSIRVFCVLIDINQQRDRQCVIYIILCIYFYIFLDEYEQKSMPEMDFFIVKATRDEAIATRMMITRRT